MILSERLKVELKEAGASLVGLADLRELPAEQRKGFDYAVSIAVSLDPEVVNGIGNGPTRDYFEEYHKLNNLLDSLDIRAAGIIEESGFRAWPMTRANLRIDSVDNINRSTVLPYKTIATRAGLGWIGKCALLVTKDYGSAVRISAVLTDAPLQVDQAVNQSRCGQCNDCVRNCPAQAASGDQWSPGLERKAFFDAFACRRMSVQRTWNIFPGMTICGLCILACPITKKYLINSSGRYGFPSVDVAYQGDLADILQMQKLAYQSEAEIYGDFNIPPLVQTMESLSEEAKNAVVLKVVQENRIVGSVRAFEKDGVCYIGKLIVHPDYQNRGLGKKLMEAIEKCFQGAKYELFTGHLSKKNLALYEKLGYRSFKTEKVDHKLEMIYLHKGG